MKIKPSVIFLFIFLAFHHLSSAAPSNGPRLIPKGRVEVGYEFNNMTRRPMDRSYGNLKTEDHFLTVSVGVFDWLTLDGKIGFGDIRLKGGIHLPKLEFTDGFAGGYGFRIKAFRHEKTNTTVILGAQHISVHPRDRSIDDDKFESFLDDWQVSGILSTKIKSAAPYVGMKLSDCEIVYKINQHDRKRRPSEGHLGLIGGTDLYFFNDRLRINFETRFFDETAFSTQVAYLF